MSLVFFLSATMMRNALWEKSPSYYTIMSMWGLSPLVLNSIIAIMIFTVRYSMYQGHALYLYSAGAFTSNTSNIHRSSIVYLFGHATIATICSHVYKTYLQIKLFYKQLLFYKQCIHFNHFEEIQTLCRMEVSVNCI